MAKNKLKISIRGELTPASPIRKLAPFAQEAKKKGIKIYHLNIGDPDVPAPKVIFKQIKKFSGNLIPYTDSQGNQDLINALILYYKKLGINNLDKDNFQISSGSSEAILWAFLAVADYGEEIIVFEPFYANYKGYASQTGVKLVPITTSIANGFHLPPDKKILEKISPKTRAILVCSPNNPTGTVLTKEEMVRIVKIAREYNLFLFADEAYREIVFENKKPFSFLQFNEYSEGIVILESLSKNYSLCGLRLGALVSRNKEFIKTTLKYSQARLGAGFLDQYVAASLTKIPKNYFSAMRNEYQKRRDLTYKLLNKIPGASCPKPEGAFYLVVKLPVKDAEDFARWLLTDFNDKGVTVMVAPNSGFYETKGLGRNEIRIAYVLNSKDLTSAINILHKALEEYNRRK